MIRGAREFLPRVPKRAGCDGAAEAVEALAQRVERKHAGVARSSHAALTFV